MTFARRSDLPAPGNRDDGASCLAALAPLAVQPTDAVADRAVIHHFGAKPVTRQASSAEMSEPTVPETVGAPAMAGTKMLDRGIYGGSHCFTPNQKSAIGNQSACGRFTSPRARMEKLCSMPVSGPGWMVRTTQNG